MNIQQLWFLADIRAKVLEVAFNLEDDKNYTQEQAVQDLIKISEILIHNK
jgi:hypothetical protein